MLTVVIKGSNNEVDEISRDLQTEFKSITFLMAPNMTKVSVNEQSVSTLREYFSQKGKFTEQDDEGLIVDLTMPSFLSDYSSPTSVSANATESPSSQQTSSLPMESSGSSATTQTSDQKGGSTGSTASQSSKPAHCQFESAAYEQATLLAKEGNKYIKEVRQAPPVLPIIHAKCHGYSGRMAIPASLQEEIAPCPLKDGPKV